MENKYLGFGKFNRLAIVPALAIVAILSGCTNTLDLNDAQGKIKDELSKQLATDVKSVTCSGKVEVKAGQTFNCQAESDIGTIPVEAKLEDDKGRFSWKAKNVLDLSLIEQQIQQGIKQQLQVDVKADCGGKLKVAKAGDKFECQVQDDGDAKRSVEVTVNDDQGNVNWKLI
ncbi:MAG: DUF4333 domain-containing protein [Cyanosarcina radialis HA8281-LM2]|jgi:hypothetical protein|nr:DUF4333 domain-containing protein [Cyanosarcina radialis HA8281-LM2]